MWLRDFLPKKLPDARIFTFGYDAVVAFSKSSGEVDDFARILLQRVKSVRSPAEAHSRPLYFICHSLGGIVVKQVSNGLALPTGRSRIAAGQDMIPAPLTPQPMLARLRPSILPMETATPTWSSAYLVSSSWGPRTRAPTLLSGALLLRTCSIR